MSTYLFTIAESKPVSNGVRLSPGIFPSDTADRPAIRQMMQGAALELRSPDGTKHQTTLVTFGVEVERGPDGAFYMHHAPTAPEIKLTLPPDLPLDKCEAGQRFGCSQIDGRRMPSPSSATVVSLMLAVPDTPAAVEWYQKALGARVLWSMGSVAGLEIDGAPFFLHEPVQGRFASPQEIGTTTVRVELFVDDPDGLIARAVAAGATGGDIQNHAVPWGTHRQGSFTDPFGHVWHVGDKSPLNRH